MPSPRRLTALLAAAALASAVLALGVTTPTAQADSPHDPATYYAGTEGLSGSALEAKLHTIITAHPRVSYTPGVWDALTVTDRDPNNAADVIDVYSGASLLATDQCHGGTCTNLWNREHTWAKSHGPFVEDTTPGTDLFHMRPLLEPTNSSRGNLDYDDGGAATVPGCAPCHHDSDSFEPRPSIKGDIARGLFYMAVSYDGGDGYPDLVLNDFTCNGSNFPNIGKLSTLVKWSLNDPPDALERARNDVIDASYQHNRNPFIDHPEWVSAIWGNGVGQGPACNTNGGGLPGAPSNLVISELYLNGGTAGATYNGSFVELFNPASTTVDLGGYSLEYRAAAATGTASTRFDLPAGTQLAPQHYAVVKLAGGSGTSGAALPQLDADASAALGTLPTTGGTVYLVKGHDSVAPDAGAPAVVDRIGYGTSNAPEGSPATGGSASSSLQRSAANSDANANSTDLAASTPVTPGTAKGGTGGNPTVSPLTATTTADTPVSTALTGSDVYGDPLTWSVTNAPQHGTLQISGSTATYTPAPGYGGPDVATVTARNNHGGSSSTTLTVTVTGGTVNHDPSTAPMTASVPEDTVGAVVALTATDIDGDTLAWSLNQTPAAAHGTASITGSNLSYTPTKDFNGLDTIGVTVSDGHGGSVATTVTVTVTPVNDAPVANPMTISVPFNTPQSVALNGTDIDGDALTYAVGTGPGHGSVQLNGGTATYTPAAGYTGTDSFTYTVNDGTVTSTAGTASVTVTPGHAPVATSVTTSTPEDTPRTFTLPASDQDGDALSYGISSPPVHGTVVLFGNQATYTPAVDYHDGDSFGWTVSDGTQTASSTASITVTSVNDVPAASGFSVQTAEDTATDITLAATDADGDGLTYAVKTGPQHGTVTIDDDVATYTPATDYNGPDSFTYTANDGTATSPPATVSITVDPAEDAPVASPVQVTTAEDTPVAVPLAGTDVDGGTLTYALGAQAPGHGTLSAVSGSDVTYTPAADFNGDDTFSFTVSDGQLTTSGTATVHVTPVNDRPTAGSLTADANEDSSGVSVVLAGNDVDGDGLTYSAATGPSHGQLTVAGSTATYVPNPGFAGTDSFTYTARDGSLTSLPATVGVTVHAVNHAPVLSAFRLATTGGTPVSTTLAVTDPDGDPVAISSVTAPAHGTVAFTGKTLTYTPTVRSGNDVFMVNVSDGHGGTASAQVGVDITALSSLLTASTPAATRGTPVTTTIHAGGAGATPSGMVTLSDGGTFLGSATLGAGGTASVTWTPPTAGVLTLTASYAGDRRFDPTSSAHVVTVERSAAAIGFSSGPLKPGRKGTLKVSVATVAGVPATGRITVRVVGRKLTATLKNGVASFRVPKLPRSGTLKVNAAYSGDGEYAAGSGKHSFQLKK